jgi:hypothetical protein
MTLRPLSQAEYAALHWTTPTALSEATYQRNHAPKARPTTRGPAGIEIPDPRSAYRKTVDGPVLNKIIDAAYRAHIATLTPPAEKIAVGEALRDFLVTMFPPADMAILRRYGKTSDLHAISVSGGRLPYYRIDLAQPVTVPEREGAFRFPGDRGTAHVVPDALLPFFDRVVEGIDCKTRDFINALSWPGQYHATHPTYPTWAEIAEAWPLIGVWMQGQRDAAR